MNKKEYGLYVCMSPYTVVYGKVIEKIYRKILLCIHPYSVRTRENTLQKNAVFQAVLCSARVSNINSTVSPITFYQISSAKVEILICKC